MVTEQSEQSPLAAGASGATPAKAQSRPSWQVREWSRLWRGGASWRDILRRIADYVIRLRGRPEEVAWGMCLGFFLAMTPTVGVQMVIAITLAPFLRVNSAAAALGVWLTNPLTIPFFYSLTFIVGAFLCGDDPIVHLGEGVELTSLWARGSQVVWRLFIGGVVVGAALALVSFYPVLYMVRAGRATMRRRRERRRRKRKRGRGR